MHASLNPPFGLWRVQFPFTNLHCKCGYVKPEMKLLISSCLIQKKKKKQKKQPGYIEHFSDKCTDHKFCFSHRNFHAPVSGMETANKMWELFHTYKSEFGPSYCFCFCLFLSCLSHIVCKEWVLKFTISKNSIQFHFFPRFKYIHLFERIINNNHKNKRTAVSNPVSRGPNLAW